MGEETGGHLFTAADVVIAGPNLGCNIASTFALSSGTLGAALEGTALERKAIAVSFERRSPRADEVVAEATRLSIRIIQKLLAEWDDEVAIYNVNIPLRAGVETQDVYWTEILDVSFCFGSGFPLDRKYLVHVPRAEEAEIADLGLNNYLVASLHQLRPVSI
ncbi:putative tubulin--tyrosine ligase pby1 [Neonectria punicea]|uniref:Tubulin--tyrosine ligase pby1 n=1 Tax=Neonectria punicea TaxID=979145 RepID=A0ABR1GIF7_9HYPO